MYKKDEEKCRHLHHAAGMIGVSLCLFAAVIVSNAFEADGDDRTPYLIGKSLWLLGWFVMSSEIPVRPWTSQLLERYYLMAVFTMISFVLLTNYYGSDVTLAKMLGNLWALYFLMALVEGIAARLFPKIEKRLLSKKGERKKRSG